MVKRFDWILVFLLFSIGATAPVSYTHLDVYKRQVYGQCSFQMDERVWTGRSIHAAFYHGDSKRKWDEAFQ